MAGMASATLGSDDPLWKSCANWLCRLQILPDNHRIILPDATMQDLAYALRDGVLLCHVASTLNPESVDQKNVNQRPQMAQFLCMKNIRVFLTACRDFFQLKETDLFQPNMLYHYTDFARVLHTLSMLSQCDTAQYNKPDISGFPMRYRSSPVLARKDQQGGEVYRTLANDVDEDQYKDFYYKHHGGAVSFQGGRDGSQQYYMAIEDEVVYEDLCAFKKDESSKLVCEFVPQEKRDYCLKELVETEAKYLEVLNMLKKHFILKHLNLKENDRAAIFMNIPQLIDLHQLFHSQIVDYVSKHIQQQRKVPLGAIFLEQKKQFLIYSHYCCALPKAQILLDSLCAKDECVRESIQLCEQAANEGRFRLRDLLAVPMQRVLKYHLLLKELVHHTHPSHEEYNSLQMAYQAMLDVSEYINEVKRDSEQLQIISEIQGSITDLHLPTNLELRDYGRLRKDADLKVQSHAEQGKIKSRYVFVFDKVMLMCKPSRGDNYSFKGYLKLSDYKIQEEGFNSILDDGNNRWTHAFMLVHVQNINVYTFFAKTLEDKDKWMTAIKTAMDNCFPNQRLASTHEAVMHTFDAPDTTCAHCGKLLKGLFYQGYRCHVCAKPMHKECIALLAKCGSPSLPELPPRPSLHQRMSSISLMETNNNAATSTTTTASIVAANADYVNTNIEEHSWYMGNLDRENATKALAPYPISTFLVRCRVNLAEPSFAISLKTSDSDVKHMKILSNLNDEFYLSDNRKFKSVVELIMYFSRNTLKECFSGLDAILKFPIKDLSIAEAIHKFEVEASSPKETNCLPLDLGERIVILDKVSESQGWWKAYNADHCIGYIPKNFVTIINDDPTMAEYSFI